MFQRAEKRLPGAVVQIVLAVLCAGNAAASDLYFKELPVLSPQVGSETFDQFGEQAVCLDETRVVVAAPGRQDPDTISMYPGAIDSINIPASTTRTFFGERAMSFEEFGASMVSVPDLTGDATRELLIGSPGVDNGRGAVYLLDESGVRLGWFHANSLAGHTAPNFGRAVSYVGHIDRLDGEGPQAFYAVGAPQVDLNSDSLYEGVVEIWSAGGSAVAPVFHQTLRGIANEGFGSALAMLNDVDKNGYNELVVGAPDRTGGGGITVYEYDEGLRRFTPVSRIGGDDPQLPFGQVVKAIGDINGDRIEDLLVGAPGTGSLGSPGKFVVYSGTSFNGPLAPEQVLCSVNGTGTFGDSNFASSAAGLDDLTGDGRNDFAVGYSGVRFGEGEVQLFSFTGGACVLIDTLSLPVPNPSDNFGKSLFYDRCDVSNSGHPDLLVGSAASYVDSLHFMYDNTGRSNVRIPLPQNSDLWFRLGRTGRVRLRHILDSNPADRCSLTLYARVTVGEMRLPPRKIGVTTATSDHMREVVRLMPKVDRINGNRPVVHMVTVLQCGTAGIIRSNVFARYMSCGAGKLGVTPERWLDLLESALSDRILTKKKSLRVRRRLVRRQRRARKQRRLQRR